MNFVEAFQQTHPTSSDVVNAERYLKPFQICKINNEENNNVRYKSDTKTAKRNGL